jgi:hypothetical protein
VTDYKVDKGASALPSGTSVTDDLFTVSGGRVVLKRILGVLTTSVTAAGSHSLQVVNSVPVTSGIGGSFNANGGSAGYSLEPGGASWLPSGAVDYVLSDGDVIQVKASDTASGSAEWIVVYEPLEPGAKIVAA